MGKSNVMTLPQAKVKKKNKYGLTKWNIAFIISVVIIPVLHFSIFYVAVNFNSFLMAFQKPVNNGKDIIWTFEQFERAFAALGSKDGELLIALKNTMITFFVDLVLFPVSIIISYFLYKEIWLHNFFRVIFYLPNIISSLVTVYVFKQMVSVRGFIAPLIQQLYGLDYVPSLLSNSRFANATVLIHFVWMSFPGAMIMWGGTFARIPTAVLEYARIDGVGWVRELFQMILPLVWPTFSLLFIMKFAGMLNVTGSVFLLTSGGAKTQTLSNWFYMQVYNANGSANADSYYYMSAFGIMTTIPACILALTVRFGLAKLVPDVEY